VLHKRVTAKQRLIGGPPKKRAFEIRPPESALGWVGLFMLGGILLFVTIGLLFAGLNELFDILDALGL
jgi:hypothetical protein